MNNALNDNSQCQHSNGWVQQPNYHIHNNMAPWHLFKRIQQVSQLVASSACKRNWNWSAHQHAAPKGLFQGVDVVVDNFVVPA